MSLPGLPCHGELTKYMFLAEWFDEKAEIRKPYLLTYHTKEGAIEMYDLKNRRLFLKKTPVDIRVEDLYLGSRINVFGRQITLVDYGDLYTRQHMAQRMERTFGVVEKKGLSKMGEVMRVICCNGLTLVKARMVNIPKEHLRNFFEQRSNKAFSSGPVDQMCESPILLLEIRGNYAVVKWRTMLGEPCVQKNDAADCVLLNETFNEELKQYLHCPTSSDESTVERELCNLFEEISPPHCNTACFTSGTLGLIKPHAIREGKHGAIIQKILDNGFQITAFEIFYLKKPIAEEFLEVYRGVVAEFSDMVEELISGPVIAMEIISSSDPKNTPSAFRKFTGPSDPEMARCVRPDTLRAGFGTDKVKNAVHCTDLPEDAILEIEYFFKILALQ